MGQGRASILQIVTKHSTRKLCSAFEWHCAERPPDHQRTKHARRPLQNDARAGPDNDNRPRIASTVLPSRCGILFRNSLASLDTGCPTNCLQSEAAFQQ